MKKKIILKTPFGHMPPLFDLQMPKPSSFYMLQMTALGPSWYHDSSSEWSDLFVINPSLDPDEGVEGVTQLVDASAALIISNRRDIH